MSPQPSSRRNGHDYSVIWPTQTARRQPQAVVQLLAVQFQSGSGDNVILAHPLIAQMQVWAYRRVALSEVEQLRRQHMLPLAAAKIGQADHHFHMRDGR
jgi:hypothetical protein